MSSLSISSRRARPTELVALLAVGALVVLCFLLLSGANTGQVDTGLLIRVGVYLAAAVLTSMALARILPDADQLIFPIVVLLGGVGLVEITRLAPSYGNRQLLWLCIGDAVLLAAA